MAGVEGGRRPKRYEAAFDAGKPGGTPSQEGRYERSEVHYGGRIISETRLRNGQPIDIALLHTDSRKDGLTRWWTERQSIASFLEEVRAGHERGDPRYKHIPEDRIPTTIVYHRPHIPAQILQRHPDYAQREWVSLHYTDAPTTQFLNAPYQQPSEEQSPESQPEKTQSQRKEEKGDQLSIYAPGRDKHVANEGASPVVSIENRLTHLATYWGTEEEKAARNEDTTAADVLDDRLLALVSEAAMDWDTLSRDNLRQIRWAYEYHAYPAFSKQKQAFIRQQYHRWQKDVPEIPIDPIVLTPKQRKTLKQIAGRVHLPVDEQQSAYTLPEPATSDPAMQARLHQWKESQKHDR